ncbi:MAG: ABC transporter permease [Actinomycetota bacterium]
MSAPAQVLRQFRFTNLAFWRNPASAFFTFAFPLMFLVIFTSLLGGNDVTLQGTDLEQSKYFVIAMATFGVISACYTNIAITTVFNRDAGILKRLRGTPLPAGAYLAARVLHGMVVGAILVVITMAFGRLVYDAPIPTGVAALQFLLTFLVGSLSFAALALALTPAVPNADAAPPIVNATILPLLFLSGIFIPLGDQAPDWMRTIANIFPVKPFADALFGSAFSDVAVQTPVGPTYPFSFVWSDLWVVAAWGLAGLALAARFFSWEPRK